ncbi:MAG: Guanylate kinase [Actinomycetota bacterium]|jgi:guanylate kinase
MVGNRLLVLAGPTAVGKGTVARYIVEHNPDVQLSVSATTRSARPGEVDGVHYYFLTDPEFDALIADGQMLEYAVVHGSHRYGTPKAPVEAALADGKNVLLEIDIQGARQVKQALPEAITVFLAPPSWDELVRRLEGRGTENAEQQARRLETARQELAAQGEFDHILVNDEVAKCATQVVELLKS